jgi:hypothetical protein
MLLSTTLQAVIQQTRYDKMCETTNEASVSSEVAQTKIKTEPTKTTKPTLGSDVSDTTILFEDLPPLTIPELRRQVGTTNFSLSPIEPKYITNVDSEAILKAMWPDDCDFV